MRSIPLTAAAALLPIVFAAPASAQAPAPTPDAIASVYACAALPDGERLACYDAAVGKLKAAETQGAVAFVDAARVKELERESFGFSLPSLARLKLPGFGGGEAPVADLPMTIERLRIGADGKAVFTMTNGQVWRQTDTESTRRIKAGREVVIKRAALGSYLMSTGVSGAIRVRREE